MGIKYYWPWMTNNHSECITTIHSKDSLDKHNILIDTLALDLNGMFHPCAQKVFKYGKHAPKLKPLLQRKRSSNNQSIQSLRLQTFKEVCNMIDELVEKVKPRKRLLLCVDGVAGISKMCIAEGTLISLGNGLSIPIEDITENQHVWGWNGDGFTYTKNLGLQVKGIKNTIKITLFDSRTLICTPDHRILVCDIEDNPIWKEAGQLLVGDRVISGLDMPEDSITEFEKKWSININNNIYDMNNNRNFLLAFSRILGAIASDGYISNINKSTAAAILGTRIDAEQCVEDIFIVSNFRPKIYKATGDKGTVFQVYFPVILKNMILSIEGVIVGKKNKQLPTLPVFLLDENCPEAIIREFLAAFFGGDGCMPTLKKSKCGNYSFTSIRLSQTIIEQYSLEFKEHFRTICILLEKVGVYGCVIYGPYDKKYDTGKEPFDIDINPRVLYSIQVPMNSLFNDKIGFRYCIQKSMRTNIASSYWKLCEKIKNDRDRIASRAIEIKKQYIPEYKCSECNYIFTRRTSLVRHQKNRCTVRTLENVSPTHMEWDWALTQSVNEFTTDNLLYHTKCIPLVKNVHFIHIRGLSKTDRRIRHTIDAMEFLDMTNTLHWFTNSHIIDQEESTIPHYVLPIRHIEDNGIVPVYDIEVVDNHSFLANGLCVHNCTQRSRRFKSAKEKEESGSECVFDQNSITPGTEFMHHLNKYIDWYIRQKIQTGDWKHLEVIFSSEKVPGEGENKIIMMMRNQFTNPEESFVIYGLDADLIMLCLSLRRDKVYVYRDNVYNDNERFIIDIGKLGRKLKRELETETAITDFIFVCFMVGNDFLPQIPGLEIFNGGIEILLDIYKKTCRPFGLIDTSFNIRVNTLLRYFKELAVLELQALKDKYKIRRKYHLDPLMEEHFSYSQCREYDGETVIDCNFEAYKRDYYSKKFDGDVDINTVCKEYIKGLQWVIHYYCIEIPSWTWHYPYLYAPFLDDLSECTEYKYSSYTPTLPYDPFQQLLAVLPPYSKKLLPEPLQNLLTSDLSPLAEYYPTDFDVDLSGKRAEWEGIVQIPVMDFRLMKQTYNQVRKHISRRDAARNVKCDPVRYILTDTPYCFKSFYGDMPNCIVKRSKLT